MLTILGQSFPIEANYRQTFVSNENWGPRQYREWYAGKLRQALHDLEVGVALATRDHVSAFVGDMEMQVGDYRLPHPAPSIHEPNLASLVAYDSIDDYEFGDEVQVNVKCPALSPALGEPVYRWFFGCVVGFGGYYGDGKRSIIEIQISGPSVEEAFGLAHGGVAQVAVTRSAVEENVKFVNRPNV